VVGGWVGGWVGVVVGGGGGSPNGKQRTGAWRLGRCGGGSHCPLCAIGALGGSNRHIRTVVDSSRLRSGICLFSFTCRECNVEIWGLLQKSSLAALSPRNKTCCSTQSTQMRLTDPREGDPPPHPPASHAGSVIGESMAKPQFSETSLHSCLTLCIANTQIVTWLSAATPFGTP